MQRFSSFLRNRKVVAAIVLTLVLVAFQRFLASHRRNGSGRPTSSLISKGSINSTTRPAEAPSSEESVGIDGVNLFAPDEKAEWGLPAELGTGELVDAVRRVNQLDRAFARACERRKAYHEAIIWLVSAPVEAALWERLVQGRFHDKGLPLDWYSVIEHEYGVFDQFASGLRDEAAVEMSKYLTGLRLRGARIRLLGGKPVAGDLMFVRALESYTQSQNAYYDQHEPKVMQLRQRLAAEFPAANR